MTPELLLANLIVAVAAFVQASLGIGFAMIAVPLLVIIDIAYAPGPVIFVMLFLSLAMVLNLWDQIDWHGFQYLMPGLAIGTASGIFILRSLNLAYFELVFGIILLLALIAGQAGFRSEPPSGLRLTGGFIAGLMGTVTGMHGPALALVYRYAEHGRAISTIAFVFVIASLLSLASLHTADLFGLREMYLGIQLVPGLVGGYLLHWKIKGQIPPEYLKRGMLFIATLSAVVLIAKGLVPE